jgi:hypothetical protein
MGKRAVHLMSAGALTSLLFAAVAVASSPFTVFPIPGLEGKRIELGGVARLSDGGAIVAAGLGSRSRSQLVVTRLNADGSVTLGYGTEGISQLRVGADAHPTALAIDPATGDSWIGLAAGDTAHSEIVALNGHGQVRGAFGHRGVLPIAGSGGPAALGWHDGRLLVAAGSDPCFGCVLSVLNGRTGARLQSSQLSPTFQQGSRTCRIGAVTSAAFTPTGGAHFGTLATGKGCSGALVAYAPPAVPVALPGPTGDFPAIRVAGSGRGACLTASGPSGTLINGVSRAPAGRVIALTPLGFGACAILESPRGYPTAMVLQARAGQRSANSYAIPRNVAPLGIFRCHQHLLVIGKRGRNAVVVVVPVTAGPHAAAASARCSA